MEKSNIPSEVHSLTFDDNEAIKRINTLVRGGAAGSNINKPEIIPQVQAILDKHPYIYDKLPPGTKIMISANVPWQNNPNKEEILKRTKSVKNIIEELNPNELELLADEIIKENISDVVKEVKIDNIIDNLAKKEKKVKKSIEQFNRKAGQLGRLEEVGADVQPQDVNIKGKKLNQYDHQKTDDYLNELDKAYKEASEKELNESIQIGFGIDEIQNIAAGDKSVEKYANEKIKLIPSILKELKYKRVDLERNYNNKREQLLKLKEKVNTSDTLNLNDMVQINTLNSELDQVKKTLHDTEKQLKIQLEKIDNYEKEKQDAADAALLGGSKISSKTTLGTQTEGDLYDEQRQKYLREIENLTNQTQFNKNRVDELESKNEHLKRKLNDMSAVALTGGKDEVRTKSASEVRTKSASEVRTKSASEVRTKSASEVRTKSASEVPLSDSRGSTESKKQYKDTSNDEKIAKKLQEELNKDAAKEIDEFYKFIKEKYNEDNRDKDAKFQAAFKENMERLESELYDKIKTASGLSKEEKESYINTYKDFVRSRRDKYINKHLNKESLPQQQTTTVREASETRTKSASETRTKSASETRAASSSNNWNTFANSFVSANVASELSRVGSGLFSGYRTRLSGSGSNPPQRTITLTLEKLPTSSQMAGIMNIPASVYNKLPEDQRVTIDTFRTLSPNEKTTIIERYYVEKNNTNAPIDYNLLFQIIRAATQRQTFARRGRGRRQRVKKVAKK